MSPTAVGMLQTILFCIAVVAATCNPRNARLCIALKLFGLAAAFTCLPLAMFC